MKSLKDREKFLTVRTAYIWSLLVGIIGITLFVVFDEHSSSIARPISLVGQALFSAAVVAITFGWISSEENEIRIERIVEHNLKSALRPVVSRTFEHALKDRSWRCHLEAPKPDDQLSDYLYQFITLSYRIPTCPSSLRFIGIAYKSPDWSSYSDLEYQLRWEFDEGLDLTNPSVFRINQVRLDGQQLKASNIKHANNLSEHRYEVPRDKQSQEVLLSFTVLVRKYVGTETRIAVATKVFNDVDGADFMLSIGSSIGAKSISSSCDGVTSLLGGPVGYENDYIKDISNRPISLTVRLLGPIQRDSQVLFEVIRANPHHHRK